MTSGRISLSEIETVAEWTDPFDDLSDFGASRHQ